MYDLIIIGAGPAGIAAAIYGARYNLKTLILSDTFGGEIANATEIDNYPGYPAINGSLLIQKWQQHVKDEKVEVILGRIVSKITKEGAIFNVFAEESYQAKAIIITTGMKRRELNVPGEKQFKGKGVGYCITCDGPLFRDKTVVVVGGGNSGVGGAVFLADICQKVYLIEMMDKMLADSSWQEKLEEKNNVEVILGNQLTEIKGDNQVKSVILEKEQKNKKEITCDGVFIEIGSEPNPTLAKSLGAEIDEKSFIKVGVDQSTNVPGVFAAGDNTTGSNFFWQALTAMSEGAIAANSVNKYLKKQ